MSGIIEDIKAKQVSGKLAVMGSSDKERALEAIAIALEKNIDCIIEANKLILRLQGKRKRGCF